jgi:nucleotide-binding universal stress UspA family protein
MPIILTATDFSDITNKAVNYACQLASEHAASVIVLHSYVIPIAFSDNPMPVMPLEEGQKIAEDRLNELVQQLNTFYPGISITGKVIYGDIMDNLEDYIEQETKPWLVILGNNGDTSLLSDSAALNALRTLPLPVLAVPADTVYRPVHTVCFAYDCKQPTNLLPIQELTELVTGMNIELHLLSVADRTQEEDAAHAEQSRQLHKLLNPLQPQYHFVANNNIDEAIQAFVASNHIDWLVLAPHKHSFFESFFHKSHTAAMVRMSHIPLVSLHQYKKGN